MSLGLFVLLFGTLIARGLLLLFVMKSHSLPDRVMHFLFPSLLALFVLGVPSDEQLLDLLPHQVCFAKVSFLLGID